MKILIVDLSVLDSLKRTASRLSSNSQAMILAFRIFTSASLSVKSFEPQTRIMALE